MRRFEEDPVHDLVIRGGTLTMEHDEPTGALPGRLVRGT
jgi:hypothetical protein